LGDILLSVHGNCTENRKMTRARMKLNKNIIYCINVTTLLCLKELNAICRAASVQFPRSCRARKIECRGNCTENARKMVMPVPIASLEKSPE
jgi:hypothetical protein